MGVGEGSSSCRDIFGSFPLAWKPSHKGCNSQQPCVLGVQVAGVGRGIQASTMTLISLTSTNQKTAKNLVGHFLVLLLVYSGGGIGG